MTPHAVIVAGGQTIMLPRGSLRGGDVASYRTAAAAAAAAVSGAIAY